MRGARPFFNNAVAATVEQVTTGRASLCFLRLVNTTAAAAYLQLFNALAADVTLGTTVPDWTLRLAASEDIVLPLPAGLSIGEIGIAIAGTTTATGNTGAAISVSALYL